MRFKKTKTTHAIVFAVMFASTLMTFGTVQRSLIESGEFASNQTQRATRRTDVSGGTIFQDKNIILKSEDTVDVGVLSKKDASFFRRLQAEIDEANHTARCARYSGTYNTTHPTQRRIFYGALIAAEPWELLEIVAAETYGIYSGMVFVEGNRTQNFTPRPFRRLNHGPSLAHLFGVENDQAQVRAFVNEDPNLVELDREHEQRGEIVRGWKELGMQPEDVGLLADVDETYTRDFLRAVQVCDGIDLLDYEHHHCQHSKVKLIANARTFESSPECVTANRGWFHPDMIIGHCIEGIGGSDDGNNSKHAPAPRTSGSFVRAQGFGKICSDWEGEDKITDGRYPLWNAADFRRTCGGRQITVANAQQQMFDEYTAFHFHNFFAEFNSTRFKYLTYGHPNTEAGEKPIEQLSEDLQLMYTCVKDLPDAPEQTYKRVPGGFNNTKPFMPIYFQDEDYRQRRHSHVQEMVESDELLMEAIKMERALATQKMERDAAARSVERDTAAHILEKEEADRTTTARVSVTDTGIDVTDPDLYGAAQGQPGDSSTATVIALATNYDLGTFKRFIGSLRRSGYAGHIIVGLEPDPPSHVLEYLRQRNATAKILSWVNCTYTMDASVASDVFKKTFCASPYPDIKIRWSRFPLARDWLEECGSCTGPVLVTDARDVIFQRDPFGPGSPVVNGLQVFQEYVNMTTQNWLTEWPIRECKGLSYSEPMLCSGTTVGSRKAMLKYLEIMYQEMKVWIEDPRCRFNINGDDQSIHNHLFYSGQLPFATSIVNRAGGIVNTIGHHASLLYQAHFKQFDEETTRPISYPGANERTWFGTEYGLTNEDGLLVEFDGSVSKVVHQWDRFGAPYINWLQDQPWIQDI